VVLRCCCGEIVMTVQAGVGVGEVDSMDDVVVVVDDAELVVGTVLVVDDDSGDSVGSEPGVNMTS
jgi:hypothetical protein